MEFPTRIDFGAIPYELMSERPIYISNSGKTSEHVLITQPQEITVSPEAFTLQPDSSVEVIIECTPDAVGRSEAELCLQINQNNEINIELLWDCVQSSIQVQNELDGFAPTLIQQLSTAQTTIMNTGEFPVRFSLFAGPNSEEEFESDVFEILPETGQIYPQSSIVLTARFTPLLATAYKAFVYLQVDAQVERIPILLNGLGVAPDVELDCDVLDFESMCIGQTAECAMAILNTSPIEIAYRFVEKEVSFGLLLSSKEGVIPAGEKIEFFVSVSPTSLQNIDEMLLFEVLNTTLLLPFEVIAEVIPPEVSLTVDLDNPDSTLSQLSFGVVPFGFGSRREVHIFNKSGAAEKLCLKIEPQLLSDAKLMSCADFNVNPRSVEIQAGDSAPVQITLLPKQNRGTYDGFLLRVFSEEIPDKALLEVPVAAEVSSAKFVIEPSVFEIPQAYVGYEHKFPITIKNASNVVGRWLFPVEDNFDACVITCSSESGVLAANSEEHITISIAPRGPGSLVIPVNFLTDDRQEMQCMVEYNARGPEMLLSDDSISFPETNVLAASIKHLIVENTGLSDSIVHISASKAGSFFTVATEHEKFELLSGEKKDISVTLSANIEGNHKDTLIIIQELLNEACDVSDDVLREITNEEKVSMRGSTKGTSLFTPSVDFSKPVDCGVYFTSETMRTEIVIENHGPETENLTWYAGKSAIFSFENSKMSLQPGESGIFILKCFSEESGLIKEEWTLKTSIPGKSTDTAFIADFECKFIDNQVKVVRNGAEVKGIEFEYEEFPIFGDPEAFFGDKYEGCLNNILEDESGNLIYKFAAIKEKLTLVNESSLSCRAQIAVHSPFSILSGDDQEQGVEYEVFRLNPGQNDLEFSIEVDEDYCIGDRVSSNIDSMMLVRLEPEEQLAHRPPLIKIPLHLQCHFPSVSFKVCEEEDVFKAEDNYAQLFDSLEDNNTIDFGSLVPGTTVKRVILAKNVGLYPIELDWSFCNMIETLYSFDITPASIYGDSGLNCDDISVFEIIFECKSTGKDGLKVVDSSAICNVLGGCEFCYNLRAEASNLAIDIEPSNINFGDISYISEQVALITIYNMSQVKSSVELTMPSECLPFIKRINDSPINRDTKSVFDFELPGSGKIDVKLICCPRVPGFFNIPLSIKAGHLEEVMLPITGESYIENVLLSVADKPLVRAENVFPWRAEFQLPSYNAFAVAAQSYLREFPLKYQLHSTLLKTVSDDGELRCYDKAMLPQQLIEPIDASCQEIITELILTNIEYFIAEVGDASRIPSRQVRSRQGVNMQFVNDNAIASLKVAKDVPKFPILFNVLCDMPPTERGVMCEQVVRLQNISTTPLVFNIERKYLVAYGINLLPEKLPRIAHNETVDLTIEFTPGVESMLGEQQFIIPLFFRSSAIGFVSCRCNVSVPSLKPMNLLQLAQNFIDLPIDIKDEEEHVLNFGMCFYGESARFELKIYNPSPLSAPYTCHVNCGVGRQYAIGSNEKISFAENFSEKLDGCFEVSETYGEVPANQDGILTVLFRPLDWYKLEDTTLGSVFSGELKFTVRDGLNEQGTKLSIKIFGVGFHPQLKFSTREVKIDPVFPKQISQKFAVLTVDNVSDEDFEVYVRELDVLHYVEETIMSLLAELSDEVGTHSKDKSITYLPDFARAGQLLSSETIDILNNNGFNTLGEFFEQSYNEFINPEKSMAESEKPEAKYENDLKQKGTRSSELDSEEQEQTTTTRVQSMTSIARSALKEEADRLMEYNESIDQTDFSYELTDLELTEIKYGRSSATVFNGKSYRISESDCAFSNMPFVAFVVHGPPLSGKTKLCQKLSRTLAFNEHVAVVTVQLRKLLIDSVTLQKFQDAEQQEIAAGKGKKDQGTPADFRLKPEYLDELAAEYQAKIDELVNEQDRVVIGMIFDGIECPFIANPEGSMYIICRILEKYKKCTLYPSETATSRLSLNIVVLDQDPATMRKNKMQFIAEDYNKAATDGNELLVLKVKEKLVSAKRSYDMYNEVFMGVDKTELKISSNSSVERNYECTIEAADELDNAHYRFAEERESLNTAIMSAEEFIVQLHRKLIDEDMELDEITSEYNEVCKTLEAAEAELVIKKGNKELAQKVEELVSHEAELFARLPQHPVSEIPSENMFTFKYLYIDEPLDYEILILESPLERITSALEKYDEALESKIKNAEIIERNERLGLIEVLYNFISNATKLEIEQALEDTNSELSMILSGENSPEMLLENIYKDSRDMAVEEEVFSVFPVSQQLVQLIDDAESHIMILEEETNLSQEELKSLNKEQETEFNLKKEKLEQYLDLQKASFTGENAKLEVGSSRWIIPKRSTEKLAFRFYSNVVKNDTVTLDIQCRNHELFVPVKFECLCDWPHINSNLSEILPKIEGERGFKEETRTLHFGNLRASAPPSEFFSKELEPDDIVTYHMEYETATGIISERACHLINNHFSMIKLENDSSFPASIVIFLKSQLGDQGPEEFMAKLEEPSEDKKAKTETKGLKDKAKQQEEERIFSVFPSRLELQPNESRCSFISAFPSEDANYEETFYIGVERNPVVVSFMVECHGSSPTFDYSIPECQEELLPCEQSAADINALCQALLSPNDPKAKAKPVTKEKVAKGIDKQFIENLLMIPRASLKEENIVEMPFHNTSALPLMIEFVPYSDNQMPEIFKGFTVQPFTISEEQEPKHFKRDVPPPPKVFLCEFKNVLIHNIKFLLKPGDHSVMKFIYKTEEVDQSIIPGRLLVKQFCSKKMPDECSLIKLKELTKFYLNPLLDKSIIVLAEGHETNIAMSVTRVEAGENNVIKNAPKYSMDEPICDLNFGICKALNHFRAEITLVNKGKYDVEFKAEVVKALSSQLNFVVSEQLAQTQSKKGQEVEAQETFIKHVTEVLKAPAEIEDPKTKGKPSDSSTTLLVDFFAESTTDLSGVAALQFVFSDKVTQRPLSRQVITISAKVKYAELQINPDRIMLFGDLSSGRVVTKNITIENTGHFPTQIVVETLSRVLQRKMILGCYSLFDENYSELEQSLKLDIIKLTDFGVVDGGIKAFTFEESGKTPRGGKTSKETKDTKIVQESLLLGPFEISPCEFVLHPEEKQIIQVAFSAKSTTHTRDYIVLDWSNKLPSYGSNLLITEENMQPISDYLIASFNANEEVSKVYPFQTEVLEDMESAGLYKYALTGNSQIPGIDGDVEELFEEQQIENEPPTDPASVENAIYSVLANQLCVGNCELGHTKKERIKFFNPFSVECNFVFMIAPGDQQIEDAIKEQIGDNMQSIEAYIDDESKGSVKTKKPTAVVKEGKSDLNEQNSDFSAWSIDIKSAKIMPRETVYITIEYKPQFEVSSHAKFIAVSIDAHLRAKELVSNDPKGDLSRKLIADLESEMSDLDRRNTLIQAELIGVGVLPEVLISPEFIDLGRVLISQQSPRSERIYVTNNGRVEASYSVSIESEQNVIEDCFELVGDVDSRLFSGLRTIEGGEEVSYDVGLYLPKLMELSADVNSIESNIIIHIMTSEETYESVALPVSFEVVTDNVCVVARSNIDTRKLSMYYDATELLFELPQTSTSKEISRGLFKNLPECSHHNSARATQLQLYGSIQEPAIRGITVFLEDQLIGCRGEETIIDLINQSSKNYAFDIDTQVQEELGISITPERGHLLAGQTVEMAIIMLPPMTQEETDVKQKKASVGVNRELLFGNPLLIRIVPILFKNPREAIPWTSESPISEPLHEYLVDNEMQTELKAEWDELEGMLSKKTKMSLEQQARHGELGKVFINSAEGLDLRSLAYLTNSEFIELNLFGCISPIQLRYFSQLDDGSFEQIEAQQYEKCNEVIFSFENVAVLQQAEALVYVLNDGIASLHANLSCDDPESPFKIEEAGRFLGRPDLLAEAVKETFPQITDAKENQALLESGTGAGKSIDKNYIEEAQQLYSSPESSPFVEQVLMQFDPEIPGSFSCIYSDLHCFEQWELEAQAHLPICHIQCSPSLYLQRERPASSATPYEFANLMAKNMGSVKVVEIPGIGVGQHNMAVVDLMNTISEKYEIVLHRLPGSCPKLTTSATQYVLASGERMELKFSYVPDEESLKCLAEEAFYTLDIPKFNVKVPLLIVGKPSEPDVELSVAKMVFGSIPFGQERECEVEITNDEDQPYNYAVKYPKSDGTAFEVKVLPEEGIVPAKGKAVLVVQCKPTEECSISKVISVKIARKSMPLEFNVKYECVKVKHLLELLPENEQVGVPMVVENVMDVDFGAVFLSDEKSRRLKLTNLGAMDLAFEPRLELIRTISTTRRDVVELKLCKQNIKVAVDGTNVSGDYHTLEPGKAAYILLSFAPQVELSITKEFNLFLSVNIDTIGPERLRLFANGVKPLLKTLTTTVNYGIVLADLIYEKCKCQEISFKNHDTQPLTLEFVSETADFFILTEPEEKPLMPGQTREISIRFQPIFAEKFEGRLAVTVNGIYKLYYPLSGEAVENHIEISQRELQLEGILTTSAPIYRRVQLFNRSAAEVEVEISISPDIDTPEGLFLSIEPVELSGEVASRALDQLNGWNTRNNKKVFLERLPKSILVPPESPADILVFYKPYVREAAYNAPIDVTVDECKVLEKLFMISGAAIGASARLLTSLVELPPCLQNSFVQNEFVIENTGDVAIDYSIPIPPKTIIKRQLLDMFAKKIITIMPAQGTISPGETRSVVVRFSPPANFSPGRYQFQNIPVEHTFQSQTQEIGLLNIAAICEGEDKFYESLESDVSFACPSREEETIVERVENATDRIFEVKTVLEGEGLEHFQVPDRLVIQPGGTEFSIVFKPLKEGVHEAKLIIPGSEGGACVFKLHGQSEAPKLDGYITNVTTAHLSSARGEKPKSSRGKRVQEEIEQFPVPECTNVITIPELFAYTSQRISIPLRNWEKAMQRFIITTEFAGDALCNLSHPDFIDLPAEGTERVIDVYFTAFEQNTEYNGTMLFKNEETEEFIKFQIKLFAGIPAPSAVTELQTTCRDAFSKTIEIPNPLQRSRFQSLQLAFSCKNDCLTLNSQQMRVPARQISIPVELIYNPRVPCKLDEFTVDITVTADELIALSPMHIAVQGTANAPRPSSVLKISAPQGKSADFELALQAKAGTYSAALTALGDVQAVFDILEERIVAKGGICDKTEFFQARNGFEILSPEISTQSGVFSVELRFQPGKMGQFASNLVVYGKGSGIWLIPVVGDCTKAPSSGIVSFE